MANLPTERLEPAPPFTHCGVDYFGLWLIKEGHKELKPYGVLYRCLSTSTIHLEVSATPEKDSFINALRRSINRRGPVRTIRCNQGRTLFVSAFDVLFSLLRFIGVSAFNFTVKHCRLSAHDTGCALLKFSLVLVGPRIL